MDKYIHKGNAIFAVSALPLTLDAETTQRAIEAVRAISAADVVEVVRCKDCEWFVHEGMLCGNNIFIHFDHFYCYYGERKEG